ncbi:MAG: phosphoribosylamine--glycine ligase [Opitutales bacterium]
MEKMRVLVLGSGGREHALVKACLGSPLAAEVLAAPGNAGMADEVRCAPVDLSAPEAVVALAQAERADLVIVGPEDPLALGIGDRLRDAGFQVYGPSLAGARLEASKAHAKAFMETHGIPTAASATFTGIKEAVEYLAKQAYPVVIKASGLAAGKGVVICEDFEHAEAVAHDMLVRHKFRESGHRIVVEAFLRGEEASIMLMLNGREALMLPASQDHKRLGEGDTGPNTGGMGAYAPAPCVTPEVAEKVRSRIVEPTLRGLQAEGIDYRGTLYVGIMIVDGDPFVIEYNVRFGDPECQILLPLLASDPLELMAACARGDNLPADAGCRETHAMIVVLASTGYPQNSTKGQRIPEPQQLPAGTSLIHAGTARDEAGQLVTAGGRVLGAVGVGNTLSGARERAYALAELVAWEGSVLRRDIGWRQLASST